MRYILYPFRTKKVLTFIIVALLALILGTATATTQARAETATMTSSSQTSIAALLQVLYAKLAYLQQELAKLRAAENGGCWAPTRTLAYGVTGSDVETLQNILAQDKTIYPSGVQNGVFDLNTQTAVQVFQLRNGIVTGGSPYTTGFGVVGPKTAAFFQSHCYKPVTDSSTTANTIQIQNAEIEDSTWNISSTHENGLSFVIENNSMLDQYINYTIEVVADSSSSDEPSTIHGRIFVQKQDDATVETILKNDDFDSDSYTIKISADTTTSSDSDTIDLTTYTSTSSGGGGGGSSSSDNDIYLNGLSYLSTWDLAVTATNTILYSVVNTFAHDQTVTTRVTVTSNATGAVVASTSITSLVAEDNQVQVSVRLGKQGFTAGNYTITITADPNNSISERIEDNNRITVTITTTNSNPTVYGVYRVYNANSNPQLFFTNTHITQADALANCKTRVAANAKVWCTWNNALIWGTKPIVQNSKPNIIFVLTDDLNVGMMNQLPKLRSLMTQKGMSFLNHFVSLSLCCPSRAATLCGAYAHNNGVFTNAATNPDGTSGAYNSFMQHADDQKTMAVWLQNAGYKTALMGKYLNGYDIEAPNVTYAIPKGWTEWAVPISGDAYGQYNYTLNANGVAEEHYLANCTAGPKKDCKRDLTTATYADKQANYMINVLNAKANDFISRSAASNDPFFLYIAPYTPHGPSTPAPKYESLINDSNWLAAHPMPRDASFNEADVSDKPSWLKDNAGLLGSNNIDELTKDYHKRLISMYGVEDLIENLIQTLSATGELDNTYIVFTSDNGFHLGEHRLTAGKLTEFDTDLRIPLIVRGPGVKPNSKTTLMTGNVDIAPTFTSLAGLAIPSSVDGRSFKETLLGGTSIARKAFLIEHADPSGNSTHPTTKKYKTDEPRDTTNENEPIKGGEFVTAYEGVRTPQYTYVHFTKNNEEELYDNLADPLQLNNIAATASSNLISKLRDWTDDLSTCQGATCRSIEAESRL